MVKISSSLSLFNIWFSVLFVLTGILNWQKESHENLILCSYTVTALGNGKVLTFPPFLEHHSPDFLFPNLKLQSSGNSSPSAIQESTD